jgi:glycosyltransferase involved in cell wall biosynthesis
MNISFLTSAHYYNDDRIFYHMAKSLFRAGNNIEIISSKTEMNQLCEGILINSFNGDLSSKRNKILIFEKLLNQSKPDIIICSEPLTILAAQKYKRLSAKKVRILYDITEWYPSKKNLHSKNFLLVIYTFFKLLLFNIYASSMIDAFIFGEWYKSKPYRFVYRNKPFVYTTYYPDLNFIRPAAAGFIGKKLNLCYSGKISREKGYINFINVANRLAVLLPELLIDVKIIGWHGTEDDKKECESIKLSDRENITFTFYPKQEYRDYIKLIGSTDIFLDLRSDDFENQRCLPIKLFYYLALGRPVIYSDLKAIRKEVEIDKFGSLVKPEDTEGTCAVIKKYVLNRELYVAHCNNALAYSSTKYNWKKIEPSFLSFIQSVYVNN